MLDTNNYAPWACATSIEARDAKVRAPKRMWFQVRLPLRRTASPGEARGRSRQGPTGGDGETMHGSEIVTYEEKSDGPGQRGI